MQHTQSLISTDIPFVLGQVEPENRGSETSYQRGGGSETSFVGVFEAHVEVEEAAGGAGRAGVGVVGLVGEDADRGGSEALVREECGDVG